MIIFFFKTHHTLTVIIEHLIDVGGGSVENSSRHNLARISLRWMIRQCFLTNTGIRFHADLLRTIGLDPASLYPAVTERPPPLYYIPPTPSVPTSLIATEEKSDDKPVNVNDNSTKQDLISYGYNGIHPELIMAEEEEDVADALCPIYDQLSISPHWWILELVPIQLRRQDDLTNEWIDSITLVIFSSVFSENTFAGNFITDADHVCYR